ncbi:MAG: iron ABC transporter permease [Chloroflexota bacterium]|nr:MAG: iron ABC transporter permease [Chloroflexota bacterium]
MTTALAAVVLVAVAIAATSTGKTEITPGDQIAILATRVFGVSSDESWPRGAETILLDIRLPRVVIAALVGAALATAGAAYQGLFRNPLADPYLLGVAPGAGFGAILAFSLSLPTALFGIGAVQAFAFVGGILAVVVVYRLARVDGRTPPSTLLLAGVAVGALLGAASSFLLMLNGDKLIAVYGWLLGGFNIASWQQVRLVAPGILVGIAVIMSSSHSLNIMQTGDEQAAALGLNTRRTTRLTLGAATLATACAVSVSGLIGFVGLIVPHAVRLAVGPDYRRLTPLAALVGAAFLVAMDTVARAMPGPAELPVGILTAGCGAPFFLFLLRRTRRTIA